MNHKHNTQAQIRGDHKAAELDDVLQVRACNHFGHQRQHAVWRQLHNETHQLHHPALQDVDSGQHALAFRRVVFQQFQRRHTQERRENHHADDGRWARAGEIGKRVFWNEREDQLRYGQIGNFTGVVGLNGVQTRGFRATLHQTFRRQAEEIGHQHADQRRDKRGKEQGADGQHADFTQRRGVMQTRYRAQDHREHQRHHDHLQQLHIAITDNVEPLDGSFQRLAIRTIDGVQRQAKDHAHRETE